jgi:hypothetical protein
MSAYTVRSKTTKRIVYHDYRNGSINSANETRLHREFDRTSPVTALASIALKLLESLFCSIVQVY